MMIVEAYQTLEDRDNLDEIEMDGPFPCTRKDAWLGYGCYFWDSRLDWAIDWGVKSYNIKGKDFVVGKCQVDLSNECYDLFGNVNHIVDFTNTIKVFRASGKIKNKSEELVPNIIQYMKEKGIFQFKSIRAADMGKDSEDNKVYFRVDNRTGALKEYMLLNQRVQICVIDKKDVILRPFNVVYPYRD